VVFRNPLILVVGAAGLALAGAQQASQPQVKVNVINVCTPPEADKQQILSALGRVPKQPLFRADFEVDRGRSTLEENPNFLQPGSGTRASPTPDTADWVRIRREFSLQALFATVQYSFSVDAKNMVETLVFRVREPKDLLELTIEDSASSVTTPAAMLRAGTPANRIKLERFGKSTIVLARCAATEAGAAPDQSAYEPLFQSASAVLAHYRGLLNAQSLVPAELSRIGASSAAKPASPQSKKPLEPTK
jgi:hypothetical protein